MNSYLFSPIIQQFPGTGSIDPPLRAVLLRATNWLGDSLMTLPAVHQISRLLPESVSLNILCPAALAPVWQACPGVDHVVGMAGKRIAAGEVTAVRELNPDLALVFPNSFGAALDVWRCRVPVRVGRAGRGRSWLLTARLPEWPRGAYTGACHQVSYYLALASCLGEVEWSASFPALSVDLGQAEALGLTDDNWVALAPGAAYGPAKQWPAERFQQVASWLHRRGLRLVLVGTGKEKLVTQAIAAAIPGSLDLAGRTSLSELMAVLAKSRIVVANDSGAMHLAAALGTPGVAIFGSTDPIATGPLGAPWHILVATVPCRPCFRRTCPLPEVQAYQCLQEITAAAVIETLEKLV